VLLDEEPPLLITLRFGARERRCAIHLLGIAAVPGVPLLLLALFPRRWCLVGTHVLAFLLLVLAPCLAASVRLAIALPAIAVDEPGEPLPVVCCRGCSPAPSSSPRSTTARLLSMIAAPVAEALACPLGLLALAASAAFFAYVFAQLVEGASIADAAEGTVAVK